MLQEIQIFNLEISHIKTMIFNRETCHKTLYELIETIDSHLISKNNNRNSFQDIAILLSKEQILHPKEINCKCNKFIRA